MTTTRALPRPRDERGSMAVEMVLLAPVLMAFVLLVVMCGRYVTVQGDIDAAARDAARTASMQTKRSDVSGAVAVVLQRSLDNECRHTIDDASQLRPNGVVVVTVRCDVPYDQLGLLGLSGTVTLKATTKSPIDRYRSFE